MELVASQGYPRGRAGRALASGSLRVAGLHPRVPGREGLFRKGRPLPAPPHAASLLRTGLEGKPQAGSWQSLPSPLPPPQRPPGSPAPRASQGPPGPGLCQAARVAGQGRERRRAAPAPLTADLAASLLAGRVTCWAARPSGRQSGRRAPVLANPHGPGRASAKPPLAPVPSSGPGLGKPGCCRGPQHRCLSSLSGRSRAPSGSVTGCFPPEGARSPRPQPGLERNSLLLSSLPLGLGCLSLL